MRAPNVCSPAEVRVSWTAKGPIDVFVADRADATPATARLISAGDRDGHEQVAVDPAGRPYFLLRDKADGTVTEVAERLLPLEQGSNFRDIGGYAGADGKHVRWGQIYRSGATPLLTDADQSRIAGLGSSTWSTCARTRSGSLRRRGSTACLMRR